MSASGLYAAPATAGTYHVVASSAADTSKSAMATVTVVAPQRVEAPVFSLAGGTYDGPQVVAISTLTSGAAIYYTLDGSTPTAASTRYAAPLSMSQTTTLKALAVLAGWTDSPVASVTYTIQPGTPSPKPWVTAYVPGWDFGRGDYISPEGMDYSAMTHMVLCYTLAGGYPGSPSGLGELEGISSIMRGLHGSTAGPYTTKQGHTYLSAEEAYVGEAHRAGVKAMVTLGGSMDNSGLRDASASDTYRPILIKNIVDHLVLADYDGVDVDWENAFPSEWNEVVRFISELRAETAKRPRYQPPRAPALITWPGGTLYDGGGNAGGNAAAVARALALVHYLDQYNLMTYGLDGSGYWDITWGYNNLYNNANASHHPTDLQFTMNTYVQGGIPKSKLGIGLGFYAAVFASFTPWAPGTDYQFQQKVVSGYAVYQAAQAGTSGAGPGPAGFGSDLPDGSVVWRYVGNLGPDQPTSTASGIKDGDGDGFLNGQVDLYADEGTRLFDAETGNSHILFKDDPKRRGYITWEDPRSIAEKAWWVRTQGYGGTIIWTSSYGNHGNGAYVNPSMDAVKRYFLGDALPLHLKVGPTPVKLAVGQSQAFAVTELTGTDNKAVTWSVVEAESGTVTQAGVYTAPSQPGIYHVRATCQADSAIYADATVTVDGLRLTVSPASARVAMGQTQTYTAAFQNGTSSGGVRWSVVELNGGDISSGGIYTAPQTPGTYHVRATSVDHPELRALAEVLVPTPVSVSLTPASAKVAPNATLLLWAQVAGTDIGFWNDLVTWKVEESGGGALASDGTPVGTYHAPAAPGTYHVTATSKADPSKSATVAVQVADPGAGGAMPHFSPFAQLPAHPTEPTLADPAGEPRILKDRGPGSAGELFALVQSDVLRLFKSGDGGTTWSYVDPEAGTSLKQNVLAIAQDSLGNVHLIYRYENHVRYARLVLTRTLGAITGFRAEVKDVELPDQVNPFIQVHGMMRAVKDGTGAERMMYLICSQEDNDDRTFCLRMGATAGLAPAAPGDFMALGGGTGLSTVFATGVFSIGGHSAHFAQLGSTGDIWVVVGPCPEYGLFSDGSTHLRLKVSPVAQNTTWTWGKPTAIEQPNDLLRPCLGGVVGTDHSVWLMRFDPDGGLAFDRIEADGTYVHDAVPSPEQYGRRGGYGVFSVGADEKNLSAIWISTSLYTDPSVMGLQATQGYWDGTNWMLAYDSLSGVRSSTYRGLFGSAGWADGVAAFYVNGRDGTLAVATVRKP
ncbi:MAG: chitobiase/beta-hexosaminidase C-terminal domain-containing protein [Acidobacteria bacterium]|nr:chitobiase/beta-hexosaminidase C-terminal domain-containing protein [Acidobacteriota bacterium]